MAKVFLTSATDPDDKHGRLELGFLKRSAANDRFGVHSTTDDPETADLILFVEREYAVGDQLQGVRDHSIYNNFHKKCFVVNPRYKNAPWIPGVYASIRQPWYDRSCLRSGHYAEVQENACFQDKGPIQGDAYLYSFRGKLGTAPVRKEMASLAHPRGRIEDTSDQNVTSMMRTKAQSDRLQSYQESYAKLVSQSVFVLCPRGAGPSSLRLFETMLMGRVPVIISDYWVPPEGPDWNAFSIRVPESDVSKIPAILEDRQHDAPEMARRARQAWEAWFSPVVTFHRVVEWCLDIQRTPAYAEYPDTTRQPGEM